MPKVSEIARPREDVVTSGKEATARELAETMEEENIGSVVIVEDDEAVGIATDRDIAVRVVAAGEDADSLTAGDVMTDELVTVEHDDGIDELIQTLDSAGVRRMPVTDDGALDGIVTLDDIVVLLAVELGSISGEMESLSNVIRSGSPPY